MRKVRSFAALRYLLWTGMVLAGFASRAGAQSWICANQTTCGCGYPNCVIIVGYYNQCCADSDTCSIYGQNCGTPAVQTTVYGNCNCLPGEGIQCSYTTYQQSGYSCTCGSCS